MYDFDELERWNLIDERFAEALYNGGIPECADPYDYMDVKEVLYYG